MEPIGIGSLTVYPFGLTAAAALAAGAVWSLKAAREARTRKTLEIFWLIALPLGLVTAHLGYALSCLDMIEDEFFEVLLDFPGGGYLLYGALIGAAAALGIACAATGDGYGKTADLLAGPFLLFGAACALGEGLIGTGYGWKVDDWFRPENSMSVFALEDPGIFRHFPFAAADPFYGYANWAVWLPIALILLAGLWPLSRQRGGRPGSRAVFSLSLYAAVRVLYESLRQDDIPKWGFVRVSQVLSGALLLILLVICFLRVRKGLPVSLALFAGGAALAGMMEFALEKKIGFLEWMPMDLCYVCTAVGCVLMFRSVDRLRRRAA